MWFVCSWLSLTQTTLLKHPIALLHVMAHYMTYAFWLISLHPRCLSLPHVLRRILLFLIIKPTRCTYFSNLFLEWNSTHFGQFLSPSSGVFHCTHSSGICHTGLLATYEQQSVSKRVWHTRYTIAVCTVKNSWWWTEKLSEMRRV
jgi:hypothetical protein